MKIQIRRGVFETNSSNEHSLTIMNLDKFHDWKNGKVLARIKGKNECDETWGNFWSEMYSLEFTDNIEEAKNDNELKLKKIIESNLQMQEDYKNRCLNHKKRIEKKLTKEEEDALSEEEFEKYQDALYEDNYLYNFDEDNYNYWKKIYENLNWKNFGEHFSLLLEGMWMTYEEYWDDYIKNNDCYSPFEHEDTENNVYIIGKYFHS